MRDLKSAYVTPNVNQAGSVIGQLNISWRNVIEAVIMGGLMFLFYKTLIAPILPLIPKIVLGFILIAPPIFIGLFGINGVPFSEWVMDIVSYRTTRCYVTLKMPMPENGRLSKDLLSEINVDYQTKDPRVLRAAKSEEKRKLRELKRKEKEIQKLDKKIAKGKGNEKI